MAKNFGEQKYIFYIFNNSNTFVNNRVYLSHVNMLFDDLKVVCAYENVEHGHYGTRLVMIFCGFFIADQFI